MTWPKNCLNCDQMAYFSPNIVKCVTPDGDYYDTRVIVEVVKDWRRRITPPDWCPRKSDAPLS